MNLLLQPISNSIGQQIISIDSNSIFQLAQEEIISLFKSYGVLLFRGFETNTEIFTEFSNLLSTDFMDYSGGAFNRRIIKNDKTVLSVNDFNFEIKLHGEMYYQKNVPLMLWFFCANPAAEKGETIVCDGRQLFNELSNSTKELFSNKKLKFTVPMNEEAWQQKYKIDNLNQLQEICRHNDIKLTIYEDKSILTEYISPAIIPSRCRKYRVFINSLLPAKQLYSNLIRFEDDSEISEEVMSEVNEIAERITTEIAWQKGDILMIDNTRVLHGRRAFSDEKREIYIRLCAPAFAF
ncbi:TauD/TfdA family dioxygenase [Nostoc sp. 106C]|uniref:TauD/TfdA family dioxygenase n=1 Tax=Nostoc sp. 106C TaxID=1932667 RepID=UPI000A3A487C|nr:TauD/TfdA family dioxygenase [Nostoc sp. 106C]OUL25560.1 taurine catabolism dioxygenase TauD [Nostoc sp. 106C]